MSDLSPAAQDVLDAANGASSHGPDDCLNDARWIATAALRALAKRMHGSAHIRRADILFIATELENHD